MAIKTFYVTRDMKHPLYRGRMLRAGEPLELDGPAAKLYDKLGVITEEAPRRANVVEPVAEPKAVEPPVEKAPAKPRKRKAKAKK